MDATESQQLHQKNQQLTQLTDENQQLRGEVKSLRKQVASLQKQLDDLHNQHKQLLDRMDAQQKALMRQAAPFRREPHRLVEPTQKKRPGRKEGHPGSYRRVPELLTPT